MRKLLVTIFSVCLIGCATTTQFQKNMNSFLGSSEGDLIQHFGMPQQVYEDSSGNRYLSFQRASNIYLPGTAPTYTTQRIGNGTYQTYQSGGVVPTNMHFSCNLVFQLQYGLVSSWRASGNDCKAAIPMSDVKNKVKSYFH